MTIILELAPETEQLLQAKAQECGLSLADYARLLLEREARRQACEATPPRRGSDLVAACSSVRGLLSDDEVDRLFSRTLSS